LSIVLLTRQASATLRSSTNGKLSHSSLPRSAASLTRPSSPASLSTRPSLL
ncbi:PREDICTED: uncharacterized protein LOC106815795, partial [Priapulus caudatus]|uniref:Uncharacterized protein LOC106815795 n=1 Tax=Priapulus caudatus TaxID=37621 RepID=A0ABM1EUB7_PRICU